MGNPRAWLSEAADEYMRAGSLAAPCPEGVRAVQAELTGEDKTGRAVRLTAWLEDGTVLTEDRWHAAWTGAGRGILAGMADVQHRTRYLCRSRASFATASALELADLAWHLAAGALGAVPFLAFAAVMFAALCVALTVKIGRVRAEAEAEAGPVERPKTRAEELAEAVESLRQRQWDAIADRAFLAAGGRERPRAPKQAAWDVTMTLERRGALQGRDRQP